MRPRPRWLALIVIGTLVFVGGTWLFIATWDEPASDRNLLATALAGGGLLTIVVGTVGMVASGLGLRADPEDHTEGRSSAD